MMKQGPIVVIDDDADDNHIYAKALEKLAFPNEVVFFESARDGLEYLRRESVQPFMVISDINMPAVNGFELRSKILSESKLAQKCQPFLFFSTSVSMQDINRASQLSAHGIYRKPADFSEMVSTLDNLISFWREEKSPVINKSPKDEGH